MSTEYVSWSDVKAKARALDPAPTATARERRKEYMRGHQLIPP